MIAFPLAGLLLAATALAAPSPAPAFCLPFQSTGLETFVKNSVSVAQGPHLHNVTFIINSMPSWYSNDHSVVADFVVKRGITFTPSSKANTIVAAIRYVKENGKSEVIYKKTFSKKPCLVQYSADWASVQQLQLVDQTRLKQRSTPTKGSICGADYLKPGEELGTPFYREGNTFQSTPFESLQDTIPSVSAKFSKSVGLTITTLQGTSQNPKLAVFWKRKEELGTTYIHPKGDGFACNAIESESWEEVTEIKLVKPKEAIAKRDIEYCDSGYYDESKERLGSNYSKYPKEPNVFGSPSSTADLSNESGFVSSLNATFSPKNGVQIDTVDSLIDPLKVRFQYKTKTSHGFSVILSKTSGVSCKVKDSDSWISISQINSVFPK